MKIKTSYYNEEIRKSVFYTTELSQSFFKFYSIKYSEILLIPLKLELYTVV